MADQPKYYVLNTARAEVERDKMKTPVALEAALIDFFSSYFREDIVEIFIMSHRVDTKRGNILIKPIFPKTSLRYEIMPTLDFILKAAMNQ